VDVLGRGLAPGDLARLSGPEHQRDNGPHQCCHRSPEEHHLHPHDPCGRDRQLILGSPVLNVPSDANVMLGPEGGRWDDRPHRTAVAAGQGPRQYAKVMAAVSEATTGGMKRPARRRDLIGQWKRRRSLGVDPEQGAEKPAIRQDELEGRRRD
jgi:hypothetical protein